MGGVMGLLIVFTVTYAGPRIGVAATVGILIAGQLVDGRRDRPVGALRLGEDRAALAARARHPAARRRRGVVAQEVVQERRASAVGLVLAAACSVQGGAAVAKSLFPQLGPPGVVFLRLAFGSAALWAIARPQLRGRSRADLRLIAALGVVLVSMNITFYEALSRAPLGIVVTVEFLGPLAVAVIGSRRAVDLLWVVLAGAGVALLARTAAARVYGRSGSCSPHRRLLLGALHPAQRARRTRVRAARAGSRRRWRSAPC